MLALIRGSGRLPMIVEDRLNIDNTPYVTCDLDPTNPADFHVTLGKLGSFLVALKARGVTRVCMAGGLDRAHLEIGKPDAETLPLLARLQKALLSGDASGLLALHGIFEQYGFQVIGAHELCPDLLPPAGPLTKAQPTPEEMRDAAKGFAVLTQIGPADIGQSCVVERNQVLAVEALPGTADMLDQVRQFRASKGFGRGGVFIKAPKPGQDWRTDLPVIGPETARQTVKAGLAGIAIEAGGVMVLDRALTLAELDKSGLFLWVVRP